MKLNIQLFADGEVVISVGVDTKTATKQLKEYEQELKKYEKEAVQLLKQRASIDIDTKDAQEEIKQLDEKIAKLKQQRIDIENDPTKSTSGAAYQIAGKQIEEAEEKRKALLEEIDNKYSDIDEKIKKNAETQELVRNKIEETKTQLNSLGKMEQFKDSLKNAGQSLTNIIKKVGKWGLLMIGVRTAYSMISSTANKLAQQNEEIGAKLQAIKGSLTNLLAPIVEVIINLVYKLLSYLNVITKSFLGIDLFKKTAKSAKSAVGSAQKLRKTLAGFDEMNILNDNVSGGGGGGGSKEFELETPDMSKFQTMVDNFKQMWNEIIDIDREEAKEMFMNNGDFWGGLKFFAFDYTQGTVKEISGLGWTIKGIYDTTLGWINQDDEQIDKGQKELVKGLKRYWEGLKQTFIAVLEAPFNIAKSMAEKLIQLIDEKVVEPIKAKLKPLIDFFNSIIGTTRENIRIAIDNIRILFQFLWDKIKEIFEPVVNWFKEKFEKARNKIKEVFEPVTTYFSGLWDKIKKIFSDIGTKIGDAIGGSFKTVINAVLKKAENVLNSPIKTINKLIDKMSGVGIKMSKLQTFSLPRLAKGGIVNMPGKGVPIGGALTGEVSREGVIPLTDSQQMALLGEAIGRYITINANIVNTMNGRVISRELQKIQQESSFANNR